MGDDSIDMGYPVTLHQPGLEAIDVLLSECRAVHLLLRRLVQRRRHRAAQTQGLTLLRVVTELEHIPGIEATLCSSLPRVDNVLQR